MAPNNTLSLPNQFTPMAYLLPELALEYQGVTYLYVGTLSVSPEFFTRILAKSIIVWKGIHMGLDDVHTTRV
jgi:hypothetical protein